MKKIFNDNITTLIKSDSFDCMKKINDKSIDVIVADPPYFLSNGGFSNSGGKRVSVDKGKWDQEQDPEEFYSRFLNEVDRILKDDGTFWVFGSMHNIYMLGYLIQKMGWKILNNITWQKSNPAPNLSRRMFTHSTETILWVKREHGRQLFNYDFMRELNGGKQMKDVWTTPTTQKMEKRFGKHPTQKPLSVVKRIIEASTNKDSLVLDPFVGSGTTCVACRQLGVRSIGIDMAEEYLDIAKNRVEDYSNERVGNIR
ncbi:DNA-methyltransferase [Apilactobacillus kunkeei]|uniref:DNA-methyltransferase n=1 Tax=Apilactobacillus kunkeei TaxID=148814 RepID=UPI0006B24F94|nr:site-specific DNA-methyltransferase [Apilactobacillus kunkeei]KOY72060.1 putative adenine-specifique DNA methyltransferase [Apilactobacillus kunkeei]KOY78461.1 putative adenine-specifique DNA methyltransferase [Apilactobacillus kunkeei]